MKNVLYDIKNVNWSEMGPGSWNKTEFKIYDDSTVDVSVSFVLQEGKEYHSEVEIGDLNKIKECIELGKIKDEKIDACDGEAWEFNEYNNGNLVYHRPLGYIYGIQPFEEIADFLGIYINENKIVKK